MYHGNGSRFIGHWPVIIVYCLGPRTTKYVFRLGSFTIRVTRRGVMPSPIDIERLIFEPLAALLPVVWVYEDLELHPSIVD